MKSIYEYRNYVDDMIQNAKPKTKFTNYIEWIGLKNFHVIIRDGDIVKVWFPVRIDTDRERLTSFRKSTGIDKNLTIEYCWFFMFCACWYKNQKGSDKGGLGYSHHEDNNGVPRFYEDKKFIHRTYQIINNKRYVFRISVELDGSFMLLHDNEFIGDITHLIFDRDSDQQNVAFDEARESIHFIYNTDVDCTTEEKVILSMQSFDLSINERLASWSQRIEETYRRIRYGIGKSRIR